MIEGALIAGYTYREMSREQFRPIFSQFRPQLFGDVLDYAPSTLYSPEEKDNLATLGKSFRKRNTLHLVIYEGDAFVGWSVGWQIAAGRFKMTSTGLLPQHRGKGIYSALLPIYLDILKARGYQEAFSRHHMTNNAVLVPKLRAGFVITGFELSDYLGTMVHLSYFFNEKRRKMLDFRAGSQQIDADILATFGGLDSAETPSD